MPGGLGVRNEHVKLDLVGPSDARRGRQIHAGVADRGRDARESPRLVLNLDDQVERNRRAPFGDGSAVRTLPDRRRVREARAAYAVMRRRAESVVPPRAGLAMEIVPPSASARSVRPRMPEPRLASTPPMPSSRISSLRAPLSHAAISSTALARACFATFVSASEAM